MDKIWKITLSDGTQFKNLKLNGNNFISEEEITQEDFKGKLTNIIIEGINDKKENIIEEHNHMELVQIKHYTDGYHFILRDKTESELDKMKMQADIEYLAMMSEIDLEEE